MRQRVRQRHWVTAKVRLKVKPTQKGSAKVRQRERRRVKQKHWVTVKVRRRGRQRERRRQKVKR